MPWRDKKSLVRPIVAEEGINCKNLLITCVFGWESREFNIILVVEREVKK